eukprot:Clim_evm5s237 gene=Clim_evmTU5s237
MSRLKTVLALIVVLLCGAGLVVAGDCADLHCADNECQDDILCKCFSTPPLQPGDACVSPCQCNCMFNISEQQAANTNSEGVCVTVDEGGSSGNNLLILVVLAVALTAFGIPLCCLFARRDRKKAGNDIARRILQLQELTGRTFMNRMNREAMEQPEPPNPLPYPKAWEQMPVKAAVSVEGRKWSFVYAKPPDYDWQGKTAGQNAYIVGNDTDDIYGGPPTGPPPAVVIDVHDSTDGSDIKLPRSEDDEDDGFDEDGDVEKPFQFPPPALLRELSNDVCCNSPPDYPEVETMNHNESHSNLSNLSASAELGQIGKQGSTRSNRSTNREHTHGVMSRVMNTLRPTSEHADRGQHGSRSDRVAGQRRSKQKSTRGEDMPPNFYEAMAHDILPLGGPTAAMRNAMIYEAITSAHPTEADSANGNCECTCQGQGSTSRDITLSPRTSLDSGSSIDSNSSKLAKGKQPVSN